MSSIPTSVINQLQLAKILQGAGTGVTVPVEDKTGGQPQGPNLAGPRVTMPGPPVTTPQQSPGYLAQAAQALSGMFGGGNPAPAPAEAVAQPPGGGFGDYASQALGGAKNFLSGIIGNADTSSVGNFINKGRSGQGDMLGTINQATKAYTGTDLAGIGSIVQSIDQGTGRGMNAIFGTDAVLNAPTSFLNWLTGAGGDPNTGTVPGMTPEQTQQMFQAYMQQKMGQAGAAQGGGGGAQLGMLQALAKGGTNTINLGPTGSLPAPPTEAKGEATDLGPYQQWLEQTAPGPVDPAAAERALMANFLGGLGSGLSNAAGADNIGDVLLAAGGGGLQGVGRGQLDQQRMKDKNAEQYREYAGMRAGASLEEEKIRKQDEREGLAVDARNAERAYKHSLMQYEEAKPEVLGASQDGIIYKTKVNGQEQIQIWNSGNSAKLALARAMGGRQAAQQAGQAMGPLGPLHVLAQDVMKSGMADMLLGQDNLKAIQDNARELMPQYEEGKMNDAALQTHMEGEIVKLFMKDKGLMNSTLQTFTAPVDGVPPDVVKPAEKKKRGQ